MLPLVTSQATPPECTKRADIRVDGVVANLMRKQPDEHDGEVFVPTPRGRAIAPAPGGG